VPATQSYGELSWKVSHDWKLVTAARSVAEVPANDVNSVMAGSYATADVSLSYQFAGERLDLQAFARLDNVFDRRYAGSVIVNDANGRFFEAAAGRNATLGFTAQLR
jgi:iron complex outermembrane receptor protein